MVAGNLPACFSRQLLARRMREVRVSTQRCLGTATLD
jgi:hypothetical protein